MSDVLKDLSFVRVYLDDVFIFQDTLRSPRPYQESFGARCSAWIEVECQEVQLSQMEVELLSHIVDRNFVRVDPKKFKFIKDQPVPPKKSELRFFLGSRGL